jgi:hypothetical protein
MNMVVASGAQRFNVPIILGNPYHCRLSRRCNRSEIPEQVTEQFYFSGASFSVSGSTASGLLLFMDRGKRSSEQAAFAGARSIGARQ